MWFDHNEWARLQSRNLHDDIHFIFGQPWQHAAREASRHNVVDGRIKALLGEQEFADVKAFKTWLRTDKHRGAILAYLNEA
jgi:hypothetical protein